MTRIAVCPGSFDPVTNGHIDIIKRAASMFDKVIVLVMYNARKNGGVLPVEERAELIRRCVDGMPNVAVDFYGGLLADYVKMNSVCAIVKGLRAVSDFEDEFQQALANKKLAPDVETVFVVTGSEYMYLSSSVVREICRYSGDISGFVPDEIREDIVEKYSVL